MSGNTMTARYPRSNLAACLLPWTERFTLDASAFERHVRARIDDGYTSLYVMGTAGEGYALDDATYQQVVRLFADQTIRTGLDPQVGVICLSMQQTVKRIEFARNLGIRMCQIVLPAWGEVNEDELLLYFKTVCGAFPDCRFLHYNLP